MVIGKPAPFVSAFVDAVDEAIREQNPSDGMSTMQRAWLACCVTAVLIGVPGVTAGKFTVSSNRFIIKWLQWPINRCDAAGFAAQYDDIPLSV